MSGKPPFISGSTHPNRKTKKYGPYRAQRRRGRKAWYEIRERRERTHDDAQSEYTSSIIKASSQPRATAIAGACVPAAVLIRVIARTSLFFYSPVCVVWRSLRAFRVTTSGSPVPVIQHAQKSPARWACVRVCFVERGEHVREHGRLRGSEREIEGRLRFVSHLHGRFARIAQSVSTGSLA